MSNNINARIAGANFNNDRRLLDYYPTPANVTVALMDFLRLQPSVIWEPACGEGHMSKVIQSYGHDVIETDISKGFDYLSTTAPLEVNAIITNPPFSLSRKFIEKALGEAPLVAMLLKSQYWHAAKRYQLFEKAQPSHVLPLTWRPDFLGKGASIMDMQWTVWGFSDNKYTVYHPLKKPVR